MYIIGIDGGGTSTQGAIADMSLNIIATAEVGATNYHNVGRETVKVRFRELIDRLLLSSNVDLSDLGGICIGGAGIDSETDRKVIEELFKEIGWEGTLVAVNDAVTALVGGNQSFEGLSVISGTGSIAYGSHNGKSARCGGWGQLIDDVGSGYYLGISALKGIMEAYDQRREKTALWSSVAHYLGVSQEEDLINFIYHPETGKEKIADLAPLVLELNHKDALATDIIESGINGLTVLVQGLITQLYSEGSLPQNERISLTVGGSLLTKSEMYRTSFQSAIHKLYPNIDLHLPFEGPVQGALRIMKHQLEKERN